MGWFPPTCLLSTVSVYNVLPNGILLNVVRLIVMAPIAHLSYTKSLGLYDKLATMEQHLNNNIYSYVETSGGQSSNLYLIVVHFFSTSDN
jgi:hypothetical protein